VHQRASLGIDISNAMRALPRGCILSRNTRKRNEGNTEMKGMFDESGSSDITISLSETCLYTLYTPKISETSENRNLKPQPRPKTLGA